MGSGPRSEDERGPISLFLADRGESSRIQRPFQPLGKEGGERALVKRARRQPPKGALEFGGEEEIGRRLDRLHSILAVHQPSEAFAHGGAGSRGMAQLPGQGGPEGRGGLLGLRCDRWRHR